MGSDTLDAALRYAAIGWHTFRIDRETKRPLPGSRGYLDATIDTGTLRAWFEHHDHNLALALRPSGLIAVDVDPRNGGHLTIARAEERFGKLPRVIRASTPSEGEHVIMLDPGGRPRGNLDHLGLGKGVDVKCNGYVLVEPSHRADGRAYQWTHLTLPAPAVPEAWIPALTHVTQHVDGLGIVEWEHTTDGALGLADVTELRRRLVALGSRASGNHTTFRAVRTIFHDFGLSVDDGWEYLSAWNDQCGQPHAQDQLERAVRRAADVPAIGQRGHARSTLSPLARVARAPVGRNAHVLADQPTPDLLGNVDPMRAIAEAAACEPAEQETSTLAPLDQLLASMGEAPAEPEAGSYAAHLKKAIDDVAQASGGSEGNDINRERPFFMPASRLFTDAYPPTPWLARGLIVKGGIAVIATEPKSAKTWLATEVAVAVASGTPVCGEYETEATTTAYFYTEDLQQSIRNRVRSFAAGRGMTPEALSRNLYCQPRGRSIDLLKLEDVARIIASCRMIGRVGFLVLDPLRNISSGKENEADSMAIVFRNLRLIASILDCTVLIVHHASKAGENTRGRRPGQRMRGSGAIHGFIDSGIYLEDLKGDGVSTFTNVVRSEVKAAKSAGSFELTLRITDDAGGEAIRAEWETGPIDGTNATPDNVQTWEGVAYDCMDAMLAGELKRQPIRTTRDLAKAVRGNNSTRSLALKLALAKGWMRQGAHQQYELTDAGRAIARERLNPTANPSAAQPEPAPQVAPPPNPISKFLGDA